MAATIPRAVLEFVTEEVNGISADAQARVLAVLESITWTPENIAECRDIVLQALAAIMPTYTDAAAQIGADMYDAVRKEAVGEAMGATAMSGYEPDATIGAIKAFVQDIVEGKTAEQFNRKVLARVDRDIRRAENMSVAENAMRDPLKPKYARVPSGSETCGFCIMLASRGFVYTTPEAASHAHDGCDCKVMPGFDGAEVEGYDPDSMYDLYREARERAEHKTNGEISREIEKIVQERVGRERSDIPRSKTAGYALNPDHPKGRHKAEAFRSALGFTKDDAPEVERQIYEWMGRNDPKPNGSNEYGDLFKTDMEMTGRNGKTARVIVSWIVYKGDVKYHLTSLYIKKRKRGGSNDGEGT